MSDSGLRSRGRRRDHKVPTAHKDESLREHRAVLWGVQVRWLVLAGLTLQTSWQVFIIKWTAVPTKSYLDSTCVFFSEMVKMILSILFLAYERGSLATALGELRSSSCKDVVEIMKLAVPSLAYSVQSNLLFFSLASLSAGVQQVTYQLKIVSAATLSALVLGKSLSLKQWFALILLIVGVLLVHLSEPRVSVSGDSTLTAKTLLGFLAVVFASFLSGFAGVFMEWTLKNSSSIWLRNTQLGAWGCITSLVAAVYQDGEQLYKGGLMQGFTREVVFMIFTFACGGLMVAMVLRYADNILRQFSTALSLSLTTVISCVAFGENHLNATFLLGTLLAILATFVYNDVL